MWSGPQGPLWTLGSWVCRHWVPPVQRAGRAGRCGGGGGGALSRSSFALNRWCPVLPSIRSLSSRQRPSLHSLLSIVVCIALGVIAEPSLLLLPLPQDKLWQGLRDTMDKLQAGAVAVWHLQRVVAKKKDPLSHACFLDVLVKPEERLLTERFW